MISAKSLILSMFGLVLFCSINVPSLDAQLTFLLGRPDVQKELALTGEQQEKILDIQREYMEKQIEITRETRKWYGDYEERAKLTAEQLYDIQQKVKQKLKQAREGEDQRIFALLDDKQSERLNQLNLQRYGVESIRLETVAQQLGLSMQQIQQIEKADREAGIAVLNVQRKAQSRVMTRQLRKELQDTGNQIKEQLRGAYAGILTAEQKDQLAKMQGEKFEFATRASRGAGGGFDLGGTPLGPRKKRDSRGVEIAGTLNLENEEQDKQAVFVITVGDERWELDFTGGGRAMADDVIKMHEMARRAAGTKVVVTGKATEHTVDGKTQKTLIVESMRSARGRR